MRQSNDRSGLREQITSHMEDYLEVIYEICEEAPSGEARVTDIAKRLYVSRPSVVGMIRHLVEHRLVSHSHYGRVQLSPKGREVARDMWRRHRVLRRFLEQMLGLDVELAEQDACRMEHTLSPKTIDRFIALEEFRKSEEGRDGLENTRERFRNFLKDRGTKGRESALKKRSGAESANQV